MRKLRFRLCALTCVPDAKEIDEGRVVWTYRDKVDPAPIYADNDTIMVWFEAGVVAGLGGTYRDSIGTAWHGSSAPPCESHTEPEDDPE